MFALIEAERVELVVSNRCTPASRFVNCEEVCPEALVLWPALRFRAPESSPDNVPDKVWDPLAFENVSLKAVKTGKVWSTALRRFCN